MIRLLLLTVILGTFSLPSVASDFFYRLGFNWRPSVVMFDFQDPDTGRMDITSLSPVKNEEVLPVDSTSEFQPISGAISYKHSESGRTLFTFGYYEFDVRGDRLSVIQDVEVLQLGALYQHRLPLFGSMGLWVGGGLTLSDISYTERFVETNDGSFSSSLEERESTEAGLRIEVETDAYRPFRYTGVSLFGTYDYGFGDDEVSFISAGVSLKYGIF